jgi:hypothetical protein
MRRNRLLEGLYDDGTFASEIHDILFGDATYNGEWKDNLPHGDGIETYSCDRMYKGRFKEGQRDGEGTYTGLHGVYKGQWKEGIRNGEGTETYSNGAVYKGQWKEDKRNGEGTVTYSSGAVYKGQFKEGTKDGQGTYTWSNGNFYEGQWKGGHFDGNGTETYSTGPIYTGRWEAGKRDGEGIETDSDGKVFKMVYSKGKLLSKKELSGSMNRSSTDDVSVLGKRSREEIIDDNIKNARARCAIIDVSQ